MTEKTERSESDYSFKSAAAYNLGQFTDTIAYQAFTFLIFNFYFTVAKMDVFPITVGFIIWSVWNAINDPLLGALSDRTKTKWGRRTPYIVAGLGPLCLVMVLLFTPPIGNTAISFVYFLIIICVFDTFYTMFSLNQVSLFPEIFQNLDDRAKANMIRQIITVIALVFATILPTFLIPNLSTPEQVTTEELMGQYILTGVFLAIIMGIVGVLFILFGLKERPEFAKDSETALPFFESLKVSLKNKAFITYVISGLATWYVFGMLPTIVPLYGRFVLGESDALLLGLLLGVAFISSAIFSFLWRYIAVKVGVKKGAMISNATFIITLVPLMFASDIITGFVAFFLVGMGLAGSLTFNDLLISTIVDDDELKTGTRREGGYYGINALVIRFSTILIFITISLVFTSAGWKVYDPAVVDETTVFGLRALMCIFPAIALGIGILSMSRFPIDKEKYEQIKQDVEKLHAEKKSKV